MGTDRKPIRKVRASAKGVAYTGIASHWRCSFGDVIVIAENLEAVEEVSKKMQELKPHQEFEPELCPQVAVFQMTDTNVLGEVSK